MQQAHNNRGVAILLGKEKIMPAKQLSFCDRPASKTAAELWFEGMHEMVSCDLEPRMVIAHLKKVTGVDVIHTPDKGWSKPIRHQKKKEGGSH